MNRRMFYLTCNINDGAFCKSIFEQVVEDDRWGFIEHRGIKNMLITIGAYVNDDQLDKIFEIMKTSSNKKFQIQFG